MVLGETAWGKMSVMTMGSFHVFIQIATLTCVFQVKLMFFQIYNFAVSLYKPFILLKETYMRSFFFRENIKYEASSFLRIHDAFVWGKMSIMTVGSFHVFI